MSSPNPATTPWVPLWNLNGAAGLNYRGAYAGATNYVDGDVVVYNGVAYACVRPTSNPPAPWSTGQSQLGLIDIRHQVGTAGEPAFVNGWHNYAAGWTNAQFWKDAAGTVHLAGLMGGGTMGVIAFTLPAAYAPPAHELFPTYCYDGTTNMVGRVTVLSTGGVECTYGGNSYFSISGISFRPAP